MIVLLIIIVLVALFDFRLLLGILNVGVGFVIGLGIGAFLCVWGLQALIGLL